MRLFRFLCRFIESKNVSSLSSVSNAWQRNQLSHQSSALGTRWGTDDGSKTRNDDSKKRNKKFLALSLFAASSILYYAKKKRIAFAEHAEKVVPGEFIKNLPVYYKSDVAKHSTKENKIWVTYKSGVYDITDFVKEHPGGNKILLAAGSSIEHFWALYAVHHTPEVYSMLEQYRIGNIENDDEGEGELILDLYGKDPKRNPILKAASVKPFNAEPPSSLLVDQFYTPNSIFYVRNHLPVPEVDPEKYRLEVEGIGVEKKSFTLEEIKKFPKRTISATVQCAGNRRSEMSKVKPVKGLSWDQAAIGNARWTGASLADILKSSGLNLDRTDIEHVHFEGLDKGPDEVPYGASIPAAKALNPREDVILAYEMNGETLPRDHGYPLRVIVPGIVGARNVKWVSKIILSDKESDSHWQQNDYKGFSPGVDWDNVDFKSSPAIQELPVTSAICVPSEGEEVESVDGCVTVKGYAWSGGGKRIVRVDVSSDGGKTWVVADLEQVENANNYGHWSWTLWTAILPVSDNESVEIWSKAVDSNYNTQPESVENIWNLRGVLTNSYHKVRVNISRDKK